jgi:prepilin-type N-terminal cleavage/methylation domain-containing protein
MVGRKRDAHGFTLIELLVSMGILLLLASLVLGGLGAAKRKARRTRARIEAGEIAQAWQAYFSDYSRFPDDITQMGSNACAILRGGGGDDNPRRIPYLDFHEETTGWWDPWGTQYQVALDADYDGEVTVGGDVLRRSVAVWSLGLKTNVADSADDICSWKER